jgi:hypothetical protein
VCDCFLPDSLLIINGSPEASEVALSVLGKPGIDRALAELFKAWEWLELDILNLR